MRVIKVLFIFFFSLLAFAAPSQSIQEIEKLQNKSLALQKKLLESFKNERDEKQKLSQIKELIRTQKKEHELAQERLNKLESFITELYLRKNEVQERIQVKRDKVQKSLKRIYLSSLESPQMKVNKEEEKIFLPRLKVLGVLVDQGFKEIEVLKVDLQDAQDLAQQIQEERQHLEYFIVDLQERQELLGFHQKLQADILKKNYQKRVAQLENYRELKNSQAQVEGLMKQFNARLELENVIQTKKNAPEMIQTEAFLTAKGALPLPLENGKILSQFGRVLDSESQIYVFKKGVEILPEKFTELYAKSVFPGKVVFTGELPRFGRVVIIDHGSRYFSLYGKLKDVYKKEGDWVGQSEAIGQVPEDSSLYFEIRSKNVAVDPLQWLSLASRKN